MVYTKTGPERHARRVLRPHLTPGKIQYDQEKGEWTVKDEDANTPIGKIAALQKKARRAINTGLSANRRKLLERGFRKQLVEIYNDYATVRFNGERDVVNTEDFRGTNIHFMAYNSLLDWRSDLIAKSEQSQDSVLYDYWHGRPENLRTPTRADKFVSGLISELLQHGIDNFDVRKDLEELDLSPAAKAIYDLLTEDGAGGYIEIANALYARDMQKAYFNLSKIFKFRDLALPKKWKQFQGQTSEFLIKSRHIDSLEAGLEGYIKAAEKFYGGDMQRAYQNLSAVAHMTGRELPEGWRLFHGSTIQFRQQIDWIRQNLNASVADYQAIWKKVSQENAKRNLSTLRYFATAA